MEVKPFKAFRFDADVVGDVGNCVSPPYDVISPSQQQQLYEKSDYNIVRIIMGKTTAGDNDGNNRYTRAAEYFNGWIDKGALKQDSTDAIYPYVQDFEIFGRRLCRKSFIALTRLQEFGEAIRPIASIRPHEQTLDEPKLDRLNLKRATRADFGLPFCLYDDNKQIADNIIENASQQKPLIDFTDDQAVRHRLFAVTAQDDIDAITNMMREKNCIIADGHHRYEAAWSYYQETGNPAARYQMIAFVNSYNEGLIILATHRLVANLANFHFENLISDLQGDFEVAKFGFDSPDLKSKARLDIPARMKAEYDKDRNAFGIYGADNSFYVAVLKDRHTMDAVAPDRSDQWRSLDVSVLHKLILEKLLGIGDRELAGGTYIDYVKDTDNALDDSIAKVDAGQKQVAFFMNPAKIQQLEKVTAAGEKMPQKSTFFYPKIHSGLTIHKV